VVSARFGDLAVLILTGPTDGPNHGSGLVQDIEEFSRVRLGLGTLLVRAAREVLVEHPWRTHPPAALPGGTALQSRLSSSVTAAMASAMCGPNFKISALAHGVRRDAGSLSTLGP
jgi:hypothetical protein